MYPIEMVKVNDPRITSVPSSISYTISFSSPLTFFSIITSRYQNSTSLLSLSFLFASILLHTTIYNYCHYQTVYATVEIFTFNRGVYFFIFHKIFFHKHFRRHELHKLSSLLDHFPLTISHFLIGSTISKPRYFTRD